MMFMCFFVAINRKEPLANYNNVLEAVNRIHDELGIGRPAKVGLACNICTQLQLA